MTAAAPTGSAGLFPAPPRAGGRCPPPATPRAIVSRRPRSFTAPWACCSRPPHCVNLHSRRHRPRLLTGPAVVHRPRLPHARSRAPQWFTAPCPPTRWATAPPRAALTRSVTARSRALKHSARCSGFRLPPRRRSPQFAAASPASILLLTNQCHQLTLTLPVTLTLTVTLQCHQLTLTVKRRPL